MLEIMKTIDLGDTEKTVILRRYVKEVIDSERMLIIICTMYYILRIMISVGGVLITSLLLLGKVSYVNETGSLVLFWLSWVISLIISLSNECIYSLGIDKKFFVNTLVLEKMKSEGWKFIELSGHYKKYLTHRDAYKDFVSKIEKLKMEHVIQNLEANNEHPEPHPMESSRIYDASIRQNTPEVITLVENV